MFENRISSQSHENNGQGNGVLHETLPGTGTLPEELLRQAVKDEDKPCNGPGGSDTQSVSAGRSQAEPGNEDLAEPWNEASQGRADRNVCPTGEAGGRAPCGDGRDAGGRFFYGNRGGPGNPYARQVALIKHELLAMMRPEDYRDILRAMVERARAGDVQAAKFVYGYTVGKPRPSPDPDRLDADEWQGLRESATWMEESPALLSRPSGRMALDMVRIAQRAMDRERAREMNFVLGATGKTEEKVREHLLDPVNGLEKLHKEMARHQTGFSKKKKRRRR